MPRSNISNVDPSTYLSRHDLGPDDLDPRKSFPGISWPAFDRTDYAQINRCVRNFELVGVKIWVVKGGSVTDETRLKFKENLCQMVDAWKRLSHRNIATIQGISDVCGPLPSLVFPWCVNGNILDYLEEVKSADVLHLVGSVASALTYLHSQSPPMVHGNVRASNILVNSKGEAVLSDAGHIPFLSQYNYIPLTNILERSRWNGLDFNYTTSSDVCCFGMTILEISTGQRPFADVPDPVDVIVRVGEGNLPERPSNCTDKLWNIYETCIYERPDMVTIMKKFFE